MAPHPEPAAPRDVSSFENLTDAENSMCDDILNALALKMHTPSLLLREGVGGNAKVLRKAFWDRVFVAGKWDVSFGLTTDPGSFPVRSRDQATWVGSLNQDHPVSATKRRNGVAPSLMGRHRAPVYLKPSIKAGQTTLGWVYTDSKQEYISVQYVTFLPGLNEERAQRRAKQNFDLIEVERVGHWNLKKAIYWARGRLLRKVLIDSGCYEEANQVPADFDLSTLVELRTCAMVEQREGQPGVVIDWKY
ncbi:hypothetical protein B0H67DRAFT_645621 [Lasiosphaeris hirsuta]|uniref:Uncharacterized protein n=1 Tax=Lasiosphaeris hirsuta TaxID=260670 RepID=A0AA40AHI0_9PEZI|nr:hypothetical protein B0H67DRAFT_645621 [Lasiosphaeris hirsuta]